ncbi:hypothetical protein B0H14DRAFT_2772543 [Mycena olivaceomarginata]|nr:hypothetical protein B0H14DRAFT_2772543 [Mycena olivaceomarginata]
MSSKRLCVWVWHTTHTGVRLATLLRFINAQTSIPVQNCITRTLTPLILLMQPLRPHGAPGLSSIGTIVNDTCLVAL